MKTVGMKNRSLCVALLLSWLLLSAGTVAAQAGTNVSGAGAAEVAMPADTREGLESGDQSLNLHYTVQYLAEDTKKPVAEEKHAVSATEQITEAPVPDPSGQWEPVQFFITQRLSPDEENILTFWYRRTRQIAYVANYYVMREDGSGAYDLDTQAGFSGVARLDELVVLPEGAYAGYVENTQVPEACGSAVADGTGTLVLNRFYDKRYQVDFTAGEDGTLRGQLSFSDIPVGRGLEEALTVPTPAPRDGYIFAGWEPELPETVVENGHYTARFVPRGELSYQVEYYYDGVMEPDLTEAFDGGTYGAVIEEYPAKDRTGYRMDRVEYGDRTDAGGLTLGLGENNIRVFYQRREDLSYTIEYLQQGTREAVAPADAIHGLRYGDVVQVASRPMTADSRGLQAAPKEIEGYTFLRAEQETLSVETTGNVVRYYYQKNLTLRAENARKVYDGIALTAGYAFDPQQLLPGDEVRVQTKGSVTHVGDEGLHMVESYEITGDGEDHSDRYAVTLEPGWLEILPLQVEIHMVPAEKVFGQDDPSFHSRQAPELPDEGLEIAGVRLGNSQSAGTYPGAITATTNFDENADYRVSVIPADFTILPSGGMEVSAEEILGRYGDGTYGSLARSTVDGAVITYRDESAGEERYDLAASPVYRDAGEYTVGFQAVHPDYQAVTGAVRVRIEKRPGLTVEAPPVRVHYTGMPRGVTAQSNLADAQILYQDAQGDYTLDESPVFTNVGVYEVAFFARHPNYEDAYGSQEVVIEKAAALSIQAQDVQAVYDGTPHTLGEVSVNVQGASLRYLDEEGTYSLSEPPAFTEAGSYTVAFEATHPDYLAARGEARVRIVPAQTLRVTAQDVHGVYDQSARGIVAEASVPGAQVRYQDAKGAYTLTESPVYTEAGTYTVGFEATHPNYRRVTGTAQVHIAPVTVELRALDAEKTYGEVDPESFAFSQQPEELPDPVRVEVRRKTRQEDAGTYAQALLLTTGLDTNPNYHVQKTSGTWTILPARTLSVTAATETVTYDGKGHGAQATANVQGAQIRYRKSAGVGAYDQWQSPVYVDAGTYRIEFEASHPNYQTVQGSMILTIEPSSALRAEAEPVQVTYTGASHGVTVRPNLSGAQILFRGADGAYTLEQSPLFTDAGEYTVGYRVAKPNYLSIEGTATVRIAPSTALRVWADDVRVAGPSGAVGIEPQSGTEGVEFFFQDEAGEYTLASSPAFRQEGVYEVLFEGRHPNYESRRGSAWVSIVDARAWTVEAAGRWVPYTGEAFSIEVRSGVGDAQIFYQNRNGKYVTELPSFTEAGSHQVRYLVTHPGHDRLEGSAWLVIEPSSGLTADAKDVRVAYDGEPHGIAVQASIEGAQVRFMDERGEYTRSESPAYTDVGEYPVLFQVSHANYRTVYGQAQVVIGPAVDLRVEAESPYVTYDGKPHGVTALASIAGSGIRYADEKGDYTLLTSPVYVDAGTYDVAFCAVHPNFQTAFGQVELTIAPASGLQVSAPDVAVVYDGEAYALEAQSNIQGAQIRYWLDAEGEEWEQSPRFTEAGEYEVFFQASHPNYESATASAWVRIRPSGQMTLAAVDGTQTYNGQAYVPAVQCNIEDAEITYSLAKEGPFERGTLPSFTQAGEYQVYYRAEHPNYEPRETGARLVVLPADQLVVDANSSYYVYDAMPHGMQEAAVANVPDAEIRYGTREGTYDSDLTPLFEQVGTYTVYYEATHPNYAKARGQAQVTIAPSQALWVEADALRLTYDGNSHGVAVRCNVPDAEIRFRADDGAYRLRNSPTVKQAGVHTFAFSASHPNYETVYGSVQVRIDPYPLTVQMRAGAKDYGQKDTAFAYEPVASPPDAVTVRPFRRNAGEEGVGNYPGVVSATTSLDGNPNYAVTVLAADFSILPAGELTVTAQDVSKAYDAEAHGILAKSNVPGAQVRYSTVESGPYDLDMSPVYTQAGDYTVYFEASHPGYQSRRGSARVEIKPSGALRVEAGPATETHTGEAVRIQAESNVPGAKIRYSMREDGPYTLTQCPAFRDVGEYRVYFEASHANYESRRGSQEISILPSGDLEVYAHAVETLYDGTFHGVSAEVLVSGAQVRYSETGKDGTYLLRESPTYRDAGDYTVYYEATHENYVTRRGSATVSIHPVPVRVVLHSAEKTYGQDDPSYPYDVVADGIVDPLVVEPYREPGQEDAGIYPASVKATTGLDQDANYHVTIVPGQWTVHPAEDLQVAATGYRQTYDGKVHGLQVECTVPGAQIRYRDAQGNYSLKESPAFADAGIHPVYFEATAPNYLPAYGSTEVEITPFQVRIQMADGGKVRGAEDPASLPYRVVSAKTPDSLEITPYRRLAGLMEDVGTYRGSLLARTNRDMDANYTVYIEPGTFSIEREERLEAEVAGTLRVSAASVSRAYEPGHFSGIEAVSGREDVQIRYRGAGEEEYERTESPVFEEVGLHTVFYEATHPDFPSLQGMATVEITPAPGMEAAAEAVERAYDGKTHGIAVTSSVSDAVIRYRQGKQGDYTLAESPAYTEVGEYLVGYEVTHGQYETITGEQWIRIEKAADWTVSAESVEVVYDGLPHGLTVTSDVAGEQVRYLDSRGKYTLEQSPVFVDAGTYTVSYEATHENYETIQGSQTVVIRPYVTRITSARPGSVVYDGSLHRVRGAEVTLPAQGVLPEGHRLVSDAVWTEGMTPGVYPMDAEKAVILNGKNEDVTHNFDVEYESYTLEILPRPITFTAESRVVVFDGGEHVLDYTLSAGDQAGLAPGHRASATLTQNTRTYPGSETARFDTRATKILDAQGKNVTEYYAVYYQQGTLEVTARDEPVLISAADHTVVYDGLPHGANGLVTLEPEGLLAGHRLTDVSVAVLGGERTGAGTYEDALVPSARIVDAQGQDVTQAYGEGMIEWIPGSLTIEPRPVTVTARSEWNLSYDGKLHSVSCDVSPETEQGGLLRGHALREVTLANNGQKQMGDHQVMPHSAVFVSGVFDVTENYDITYQPGTLQILPGTISLKAEAGSRTACYDGTPQGADPEDWKVMTPLANESSWVEAELSGEATDVGEVPVVFASLRVYDLDAGGNPVDVTENYAVETTPGVLTITPRPLTLRGSDRLGLSYDGQRQPQRNQEVTLGGSGLAPGHQLTQVEIPFTAREPGTYADQLLPRNAQIFAGEQNVTRNYHLEYLPGTLTILPGGSEGLRATDILTTYNGQSHTLHITGVVEGETIEYRTGGRGNWSRQAPAFRDVVDTLVSVRAVHPNGTVRECSARVRIEPAPLELRFESQGKTYGQPDPDAYGYAFLGETAPGETPKISATPRRSSGEEVGVYAVGLGDLRLVDSGAFQSGNYTLTVVPGTFTIHAAVTYDDLGGSVMGVPGDQTRYAPGSRIPVATTAPVHRDGYTFLGWDLDPAATLPAYPADHPGAYVVAGKSSLTFYPIFALRQDLVVRVHYFYEAGEGADGRPSYVQEGSTTLRSQAFGAVIGAGEIDWLIQGRELEGYAYADSTGLDLTVGTNASENVVNVYYDRARDLSYTILYFAQDAKGTAGVDYRQVGKETVRGIMFGAVIDTVDADRIRRNQPTGYGSVRLGAPLVVGTDTAANTISVYFDKSAVPYRVEYYFDGELDAGRTEQLYGRDQDGIQSYPDRVRGGYRFERVENLPLRLSEGMDNVIRVYYEKIEWTLSEISLPAMLGSGEDPE